MPFIDPDEVSTASVPTSFNDPDEVTNDQKLEDKTKQYRELGVGDTLKNVGMTVLSSALTKGVPKTLAGVAEQIPLGIQAGGAALAGLGNKVLNFNDPDAYEAGKHWFSSTEASKILTPQTDVGRSLAAAMGAGIDYAANDYMQQPENIKKVLNIMYPGAGFDKSIEAQGVVSGLAKALPDVLAVEGVLKPALKGGRDIISNFADKRSAPAMDAKLDALDKQAPVVTPPTSEDLGAQLGYKNQVNTEQAARLEAAIAKQNPELPTIQMDEQGRVANDPTRDITYENVPPDGVIPRDAQFFNGERDKPMLQVPRGNEWQVDENGIPVRQGLPEATVAPDYINDYMRQDVGARNDLGNAIQEANGPKLGPDDVYGSGPLNTSEGRSSSMIPRGQRGGLDFTAIADSIKKGYDSVTNAIDKLSSVRLGADKTIVDYGKSIPGMGDKLNDFVIRPDTSADALPKILAEGKDGPPLIKGIQQGLQMTGEKVGSGAMKFTSNWLNWADKRTSLDYKNTVRPVERSIAALKDDMIPVAKVLQREMFNEKRYTPEQLSTLGLSDKQMKAYNGLRDSLDNLANYYDQGRAKLGLEPLKRNEAYLASTRSGAYHLVVNGIDKDGVKYPAYVSQFHSYREFVKALNWFKETMKDNKSIDVPGLDKYTADGMLSHATNAGDAFRVPNRANRVPRDVLGAYHETMKLIDPDSEAAKMVAAAIQDANEKAGYNIGTTKNRFLDKTNMKGFEGNMPWLSDKENATRLLNAQLETIKEGMHWTNMQEALGNIKDVISNPDLINQQPRNIAMVKEVMNQQLGLSKSLLKDMEDFAMHNFFGRDRASLSKAVNSVKALTYMVQLGGNLGYMISTPITAMFSTGMALRERGLGALSPTVMAKATMDGLGGLLQDLSHEMGGTGVNVPMTPLGKYMLKYAEDNGIINKTLLNAGHERIDIGSSPSKAGIGLSATISLPEKVSRLMPFMAFAHHLDEMGTLKTPEAIAKRAEELTNLSQVNFRGAERPLMVSRLGSLGSLGYVYKAPIFNYFHQLSTFARDAVNGPTAAVKGRGALAMMGLLGITAGLGGALALPLVNEADGMWNWLKDMQAEHFPESYKPGIGLKGYIISHMDKASAYGALSKAMGVQMSNRFSPNIGDVQDPMAAFAPVTQELTEQKAAINAVKDPTMQNAVQAIYANAPRIVQGQMQRHMDMFKGPKQANGQIYLNPRDLNSERGTVLRTPRQEDIAQYGLRDLDEAKNSDLNYILNKEYGKGGRVETAYNGVVDKLWSAVVAKDPIKTRNLASKALSLIPDDSKLQGELESKVNSWATTPQQRDIMNANNAATIQKVKALMDAAHASK